MDSTIRFFPDIDVRNNEIADILRSHEDPEKKMQKILSNHFRAKRGGYFHPAAINSEAAQINKMFPSLKLTYIQEQLGIFRDLPNRKEIVLRIITHCKDAADKNRVMEKQRLGKRNVEPVESFENLNNNKPLIKVRKLKDMAAPHTITSQEQLNSHVATVTPAYTEQGTFAEPAALTEPPFALSNNFQNDIMSRPSVISAPIQSWNQLAPIGFVIPPSMNEVPTSSTAPESEQVVDWPFSNTDIPKCEAPAVIDTLDLPLLDFGLPIGRNCTITSEAETESLESNEAQPYVDPKPIKVQEETKLEVSSGSEEKRESQDSNTTEIYSVDMEGGEENQRPVARNYSVKIVGPVTIKINTSGMVEQKEMGREGDLKAESGGAANGPVEPPHDLPSSSKETTTNADQNFNLIEYVNDITKAPWLVIERYCRKMRLPTNVKPSPIILNELVNRTMPFAIELEDSDTEEYNAHDDILSFNCTFNSSTPRAVKVVPEKDTNAINLKNLPAETSYDKDLYRNLTELFADACPDYLKGLCRGKTAGYEVLDDLINVITSVDYPKRRMPSPEPESLPENHFEILQEFLPDADPCYLRMMVDKLEGKNEKVKAFLNEAMEKRDYPTMKDYIRRQQVSAQQKQYTKDFNVENFIKVIPDPKAFFSDPSRTVKMSVSDSHYALVFLRNKYNKLAIKTIQSTFQKNNCSITKTITELNKAMTQSHLVMKGVRRPIELPNNVENIPLLQEIAYFTHKAEITQYLEQKAQKEIAEREDAKNKGLLKTCSCCYDEEVLPRDIFCCENNCEFCKSCVVKSSEVRFGEGKLDFPCLMNCSALFSLQTLQAALAPKLFSKIAQKKDLEEVKAAGIEELETCPFCDFATIPAEGYNIFTCMNPDCMKESCRMCKEPSHVPLRCDEIEKDEDVRNRVHVENKMTEALLRKCYKCGVKFFKEEGCNMMTCSCGAQMCYVCGKPVRGYNHFNGNGGDRFDLCPLYSDTNVLNKENVLKAAAEAKAEIGNVELKYDPTTDLNRHYQERKKMFPHDHLLVGQVQPAPQLAPNRGADLHLGALALQLRQLQGQLRNHHHHRHRPQ